MAVITPVCYFGIAKLDRDKKLFAYMIVAVIMVIAALLVYRLGFAEVMSNYKAILNNLL